MDIFVASDETLVAVVEIKCSKWDTMTLAALRRNVKRQARQIWDYIESQLDLGKDVSPGVIFPKLPKDTRRMQLVEQLFNEEGIAVVWEDETAMKRKARL
jgi:aspartate/methionine/tyrosine aminotransferase